MVRDFLSCAFRLIGVGLFIGIPVGPQHEAVPRIRTRLPWGNFSNAFRNWRQSSSR